MCVCFSVYLNDCFFVVLFIVTKSVLTLVFVCVARGCVNKLVNGFAC